MDSWPPWLRHLFFTVAPVLLAYVGTEVLPKLKDNEWLAGVLGIAVTAAVAWLTPLTRQYGVGTPPLEVDTGD